MSDSVRTYGLQSVRLLCPWDSIVKNTGVGCHALLQGIFPAQGSNPYLMSPTLEGRFFTTSTTWEAPVELYFLFNTHGKNHCFVFIFLVKLALYNMYLRQQRRLNSCLIRFKHRWKGHSTVLLNMRFPEVKISV